jgi:hypothetical protein
MRFTILPRPLIVIVPLLVGLGTCAPSSPGQQALLRDADHDVTARAQIDAVVIMRGMARAQAEEAFEAQACNFGKVAPAPCR